MSNYCVYLQLYSLSHSAAGTSLPCRVCERDESDAFTVDFSASEQCRSAVAIGLTVIRLVSRPAEKEREKERRKRAEKRDESGRHVSRFPRRLRMLLERFRSSRFRSVLTSADNLHCSSRSHTYLKLRTKGGLISI